MTNEQYCEHVQVGQHALIFFPGQDGGRLIPVTHIKSVVPDYKGGGSMVFLTDNDKAIKVPQTPEEIVYDLNETASAAEAE